MRSCGAGESAGVGAPTAAWARVQQYIARRVDGVFFAPLEGFPPDDTTNVRIVTALDEARIPVVLLDRSVYPYPKRGPYDLVGIDNRRVGFTITEHLLAAGARRVAFLGPHGASTIGARRAGYREAIDALEADSALRTAGAVARRSGRTRGLSRGARAGCRRLCARPGAAQLMHALLGLGRRIPGTFASPAWTTSNTQPGCPCL